MVPRGPRASRPHTGVPYHMEQPQRTPSLDLDLTSLNRWLDQSSAAPARGSPPDDAPESPLRSSRPAAPLFVMRTSDGADAWRHKQSATPAEETGAWRHKQPVPRAPPSTPKPFVVPTAEIAAALRSKDEQLGGAADHGGRAGNTAARSREPSHDLGSACGRCGAWRAPAPGRSRPGGF